MLKLPLSCVFFCLVFRGSLSAGIVTQLNIGKKNWKMHIFICTRMWRTGIAMQVRSKQFFFRIPVVKNMCFTTVSECCNFAFSQELILILFLAQRALRNFDPEPEKNYSEVNKLTCIIFTLLVALLLLVHAFLFIFGSYTSLISLFLNYFCNVFNFV